MNEARGFCCGCIWPRTPRRDDTRSTLRMASLSQTRGGGEGATRSRILLPLAKRRALRYTRPFDRGRAPAAEATAFPSATGGLYFRPVLRRASRSFRERAL